MIKVVCLSEHQLEVQRILKPIVGLERLRKGAVGQTPEHLEMWQFDVGQYDADEIIDELRCVELHDLPIPIWIRHENAKGNQIMQYSLHYQESGEMFIQRLTARDDYLLDEVSKRVGIPRTTVAWTNAQDNYRKLMFNRLLQI